MSKRFNNKLYKLNNIIGIPFGCVRVFIERTSNLLMIDNISITMMFDWAVIWNV